TGRRPRSRLGRRRRRRPRRDRLLLQPGRASLLRDRPAPWLVAQGSPRADAGAGVQFAAAVRAAARRRALREDAGRHADPRPRAAGLAEPEPRRLGHRRRDAPVQRPRGRSRLALSVPQAPRMITGKTATAATPGFVRIPPCSARALEIDTGDLLEIADPEGEQVCDLVAFHRDDLCEYLSS